MQDFTIQHYSPAIIQEIVLLLIAKNVDFNTFGVGQADTLDQLVDEVRRKKCTLSVENGRLLRRTRVVCVTVQSPHGSQYLWARKQRIAATGAVIGTRPGIFPAKKTPRDVSDVDALRSVMLAELGIHPDSGRNYKILSGPDTVEQENRYPSFPQLDTIYTQQFWEVQLAPGVYQPEGYNEVSGQGNETTFLWCQEKPRRP